MLNPERIPEGIFGGVPRGDPGNFSINVPKNSCLTHERNLSKNVPFAITTDTFHECLEGFSWNNFQLGVIVKSSPWGRTSLGGT